MVSSGKSRTKIAAIVIFYRPTLDEVKRIDDYAYLFEKVFIYDNTEPPSLDVPSLVKSANIVYHKACSNDGISKAYNYVIRNYLIPNKYDFFFILDQDTSVRADNVLDIKDYINQNYDEKIGIYCPQIILDKKQKLLVDDQNIPFTINSCSMVSIEAFNRVGGYDENYFLDGVDRDFCKRIVDSGYLIRLISRVVIDHELGDGKKNLLGLFEHNALRNYYIAFGRRYYVDKFYHKFFARIKPLYISEMRQILSVLFLERDKKKKLYYIKKAKHDYREFTKQNVPN